MKQLECEVVLVECGCGIVGYIDYIVLDMSMMFVDVEIVRWCFR